MWTRTRAVKLLGLLLLCFLDNADCIYSNTGRVVQEDQTASPSRSLSPQLYKYLKGYYQNGARGRTSQTSSARPAPAAQSLNNPKNYGGQAPVEPKSGTRSSLYNVGQSREYLQKLRTLADLLKARVAARARQQQRPQQPKQSPSYAAPRQPPPPKPVQPAPTYRQPPPPAPKPVQPAPTYRQPAPTAPKPVQPTYQQPAPVYRPPPAPAPPAKATYNQAQPKPPVRPQQPTYVQLPQPQPRPQPQPTYVQPQPQPQPQPKPQPTYIQLPQPQPQPQPQPTYVNVKPSSSSFQSLGLPNYRVVQQPPVTAPPPTAKPKASSSQNTDALVKILRASYASLLPLLLNRAQMTSYGVQTIPLYGSNPYRVFGPMTYGPLPKPNVDRMSLTYNPQSFSGGQTHPFSTGGYSAYSGYGGSSGTSGGSSAASGYGTSGSRAMSGSSGYGASTSGYSGPSDGHLSPDITCGPVSGAFCHGRTAGLYSHPASGHCFVQCDHVGVGHPKSCSPGTTWKELGPEPALFNYCS